MSAFEGKADMNSCGCPLSRSLLGVKRTCVAALHESASDPKRTSPTHCKVCIERTRQMDGNAVWRTAMTPDRAAMLRSGSGLPRQHCQHPHDEVAKLLQVGEQEIGSHFVADLPVLAEEARLELDVRLDVVHQRRITKTQHAAQMALRDCGADRTWRRTDHTRRLAREGVLTPGPARPVDRVLQPARNGAIELRRHEQHGIDIGNRLLKRPRYRWIVGVVVLA